MYRSSDHFTLDHFHLSKSMLRSKENYVCLFPVFTFSGNPLTDGPTQSFSFHAPDLCDSPVACRWIPSSPFKTSMLCTDPAKPWPRYQRLSFLDMVRVTLARYHRSRTSTICRGKPHQFFEKILQSVYSAMSSNMFGAS